MLPDLVMRGHLSRKEEEYVELLGLLIEAYEEEHYQIRDASPVEVINELIATNDLRQKDLVKIFGSESLVSCFERPVASGSATHPSVESPIQGFSRSFYQSVDSQGPVTTRPYGSVTVTLTSAKSTSI